MKREKRPVLTYILQYKQQLPCNMRDPRLDHLFIYKLDSISELRENSVKNYTIYILMWDVTRLKSYLVMPTHASNACRS